MSIIASLMGQTIDYIYSCSKDGWSTVTQTVVYSSVPCRWIEKIGKVIDQNREEKTYTVETWLTPEYAISYGYEFSVNNVTYKIVGIEKKYDIVGTWDHTKVFLA